MASAQFICQLLARLLCDCGCFSRFHQIMAIKNISLCLAVLPEFVFDISVAVCWAERRRLTLYLFLFMVQFMECITVNSLELLKLFSLFYNLFINLGKKGLLFLQCFLLARQFF